MKWTGTGGIIYTVAAKARRLAAMERYFIFDVEGGCFGVVKKVR